MITVGRLVVLALALVITKANAQEFQGVATYRTMHNVDIKIDSSKMNSEMHARMMEMMKKQFQKTYILNFNKQESIYKEDVSLDKPQAAVGGAFEVVMIGNGSGMDVHYKNTKTNRYSDQKDTMGKIFLVKDTIQNIAWNLESETKYIGEYKCYKATYTKQVEVSNMSFSVTNSETKNDKEKEEPEMEERLVTAWYTPQIPVSNGPAKYQGLPGLILEVHDGKLTIICSKIVLNPENTLEIKEPEKGTEVNEKEYEEIMEKKAKEMMERYAPRKGRKGESIEIRIGG
jgi:GLPGLI family protein